ncbi:ciliary-associated calcium-binding coiled-coil protein 1 [Pelobates fuscus]|uniref:ciliary-associated calcium-binding coiled-coil protein 1 n=1 Tax=Pelobates fuscus TaxID=191477 RepID=UPI002FE46371
MAASESGVQEDIVNEKEDSLTFAFLSLTQVSSLLEQDVNGVQSKMEEILNFSECQTNLKESVLVDYYVSGFWWGKERNFTSQQLAGFMELLHNLMVNLETRHVKLEENLIELSRTMTGIGKSHLTRKGSLHFFTVEQAKDIIDYLKISLFQHYRLYEYMFKFPRDEMVICAQQVIETAKPADTPFPAPLEEGIPSAFHSKYLSPPTVLLQDTEETKAEINEMLKVEEEAYTAKIEILEKP